MHFKGQLSLNLECAILSSSQTETNTLLPQIRVLTRVRMCPFSLSLNFCNTYFSKVN